MKARGVGFLMMCVFGCGPAKHEGPITRLIVRGTPAEATVLVDEQPLGTLATVGAGIALPPGQHRLTVQAQGYFPADVLLEIGREGGVHEQKVELVAIPEP